MSTTRAGSFGSGLGTPSENASQILAAMRVVTPRLACARARARSPSAEPSARSCVTAVGELGWFLDERERAGVVKFFGDGREVFHVRADDDGLAEIGRLQNVVAAALRQRSAHEDRSGAFKEAGQFADGVEQQNAGQRQRR